MQAAVTTKLQFGDLRQGFLAPHARRNFIEVIDQWSLAIRAKASARLNKAAPAKTPLMKQFEVATPDGRKIHQLHESADAARAALLSDYKVIGEVQG